MFNRIRTLRHRTGDEEPLRCSFCNKEQRDVRKLIAGPSVFICDECVEVCRDIIADDNRFENQQAGLPPGVERELPRLEPPPPGSLVLPCVICGAPAPLGDALVLENRGPLCAPCVTAIEGALAARREGTES